MYDPISAAKKCSDLALETAIRWLDSSKRLVVLEPRKITPEEYEAGRERNPGASSAFQGGTYRLGGHGLDSEVIRPAAGAEPVARNQPVSHLNAESSG